MVVVHCWLPNFVLKKKFVGVVRFMRSIHKIRLFGVCLKLGIAEAILLFEVQAEECFAIVVLDALYFIKEGQVANLQQLRLLLIIHISIDCRQVLEQTLIQVHLEQHFGTRINRLPVFFFLLNIFQVIQKVRSIVSLLFLYLFLFFLLAFIFIFIVFIIVCVILLGFCLFLLTLLFFFELDACLVD